MLKLEKKFLKHLNSKNYQPIFNYHWFIGISGGLDSLVLLHLLHMFCDNKKKSHLTAIHFNHKLNQQSEQWQKHCQLICDKLKIPLITDSVKHLNWNKPRENQPSSPVSKSFENEARNERYSSFLNHLPSNACLFLAHHKDDQIETFLFRLARGSSFEGLSAINEHRIIKKDTDSFSANKTNSSKIYLKRPFLNLCDKKDLYQYAKEKGLEWIEDSSNQDLRIKRNLIRHQVLPQIKNIHPKVDKNLLRQVKKHKQMNSLIQEIAQEDICYCLKNKHLAAYLSIKRLKKLSKFRLQNLLYQFAHQNWGFYFDDSKQIKQFIKRMVYQSKPMNEFNLKNIRFINFNSFILAFRGNQLIQKPVVSHSKKTNSNRLKIMLRHGFLSFEKVSQGGVGVDINQLNQLELVEAVNLKKIKLAKKKHHQSLNKLFQEYNIPVFFRSFYPFIGLNNKIIVLPNIGLCQSYQAREQLEINKTQAVKIIWNYW